MLKKRRNIAFSLSFLDIMACGFGAVTLLFLILRHNFAEEPVPDPSLTAEVQMLQEDVSEAEVDKVEVLNSLDEIELELVTTQGLSTRFITELEEIEESINRYLIVQTRIQSFSRIH